MCTGNGCSDTSQITIPVGPAGSNGTNGTNGTNGSNGIYGGFSSNWLFSTSTSTTPASTFLRFNNATLSSVTAIYVSDTNGSSVSVNNFLESFKNNDGTQNNYGLIRVWKEYTSTTYLVGKITNVVDNGTDHTITITWIESNGSFAANDVVIMSFTPNGTNANVDSEIIAVDQTSTSTNNTVSFTNFGSGAMPSGILTTAGDTFQFTGMFHKTTVVPKSTAEVKIEIGGNAITTTTWILTDNLSKLVVEGELTMETSTAARLKVFSYFINNLGIAVPSLATIDIAFPFDISLSNLLRPKGKVSNASDAVVCDQLLIKNFDI